MWYIGTEQQCLNYDAYVTANENYSGTTTNWYNPVKHKDHDIFAIEKHEKYEAQEEMDLVESLPLDWWTNPFEN